MLFLVSMMRWQGCSSTLDTSCNKWIFYFATLILKFSVWVEPWLGSFHYSAWGWLQEGYVLLLAHLLQFLLMCLALPQLWQVNCFCDWEDLQELLAGQKGWKVGKPPSLHLYSCEKMLGWMRLCIFNILTCLCILACHSYISFHFSFLFISLQILHSAFHKQYGVLTSFLLTTA